MFENNNATFYIRLLCSLNVELLQLPVMRVNFENKQILLSTLRRSHFQSPTLKNITFVKFPFVLHRNNAVSRTAGQFDVRRMAHDPSSPPKCLVTRNWSPETRVQVAHTRHEKMAPETWRLQFRRFTSTAKTPQVQH